MLYLTYGKISRFSADPPHPHPPNFCAGPIAAPYTKRNTNDAHFPHLLTKSDQLLITAFNSMTPRQPNIHAGYKIFSGLLVMLVLARNTPR